MPCHPIVEGHTSTDDINPSTPSEWTCLLDMTRERLRSANQELETVTEELQSANQEFLLLNEELQAANEELETSKEELIALNEELKSANLELSRRHNSLIRSNSDLVNLFDSTSIATLFLDNGMRIRRFTPRLQDIFRVRDGDEGRPISDIATHLVGHALPDDVAEVLRTLKAVEHEVVATNGLSYLMQIRPYRDLTDTVHGAVLSFVDISERKQHEQARSRLAAIVESSQDGIISHDLDGLITSWNAGAELLFGYTAAEAIGARLATLIDNPEAEAWPGILASLEDGPLTERFDSVAITKSRRRIEVSITISPLRDGDGRSAGASVVARDISERKAAERTAELLLGELDHRVKNILAIVSAVVSQTLAVGLTPEEFAREVEGRIMGVAKAHSLLTQSGLGTMSLRDVILTELAPYDRGDGHIVIECPDIDLTPKAGMAIAMAMHELTSNAAKYGALSTSSGHLSVIASTSGGTDEALLNLLWTEANGPPVEAPTRRGFGTSLIERALAYELDAVVIRTFDRSGMVCAFEIPITDEVCHMRRHGSH
jgi:two-component system CheB/CheR fusion protein